MNREMSGPCERARFSSSLPTRFLLTLCLLPFSSFLGCWNSPTLPDTPCLSEDARVCAGEKLLRRANSEGAHSYLLNFKGDANPEYLAARLADWNGKSVLISQPQILLQQKPEPFMVVDVYLRDAAENSTRRNYAVSLLVSATGRPRNIFLLPPCRASCAAVYSGPFDPSEEGKVEEILEKLAAKAMKQPGTAAKPDMLELALQEVSRFLKALEPPQ